MGLAQAEQKEVRERGRREAVEGAVGALPARAVGGWRASGSGQTSRRTGWRAGGGEGRVWLGRVPGTGHCFGRLAGEEATWQPPSLPLSPRASLSLHLTVRAAAAGHPSCLVPTSRLSHLSLLGARPPSPPGGLCSARQPLSLLVSGPCFSAHLLFPPPLPPNVCLPEGPVERLGGLTCSLPSRDQRCCCRQRPGLPQREWLLPDCPRGLRWAPGPPLRPSSTTLSPDPAAGNHARLWGSGLFLLGALKLPHC